MGVLGAPLYHVGVINGSYWYLRRLSMEKLVDLKVLSVLICKESLVLHR